MAVSGQPDSVGSHHCNPSKSNLEPFDASDSNQVAEVLQVYFHASSMIYFNVAQYDVIYEIPQIRFWAGVNSF